MSKLWRNEDRLREMYWEEDMNIEEVSNELGCGHNTVWKWMKRFDIERETAKQNKPVLYRTNDRGYERWRHDLDKQYVVSVHRLACVAWFGYDEVVDKHIHHKNTIPWDNREENLEPLEPRAHQYIHTDKLDVSDDELRDYIYRKGLSLSEIASREDVYSEKVGERVKNSPVCYPVKPYKREWLLRLLIENNTVQEIADMFSISKYCVQRYLNKFDIDGWRFEDVEGTCKYDEDKLRNMYFDQDMTMYEIANVYGVTQGSISQIFDRLDIETGYKTSAPDETPWRDKQKLKCLYIEQGMSMQDVADHWDCSYSVINKWVHEHDLR